MRLADAARRLRTAHAMLLLGAALCAAAPLWRTPTLRPDPAPQLAASDPPPAAGANESMGVVLLDAPREPRHARPGEWPREWDGKPLRPLALSAVEQRFAAQFPGRVARLTDGEAVLVWRDVDRPTRLLHPAADCYRALGYRIEQTALEYDARSRLWRCFIATQGAQRLRVCERIEDANGASFSDASSWFWAAQLGRSRGPWQAITVTRTL
jgi:hypothetical protein